MSKKLLGLALAGAMVLSMSGMTAMAEGKTVGILMPTQSSERWINDGANMKAQLEEKGYNVELQYAEDDTAMQVSQLENYVSKGVDCLVIAAIDSGVLVNAEAQAKEAGIPIIAYDRLLMNTDAVSYYATFDNKGVGTVIANYIKEAKDLDAAREAGESYTIEFFMGSPDDNNALFLYNGIMEVLQEYLDDGTLVCKSGRTIQVSSKDVLPDLQTSVPSFRSTWMTARWSASPAEHPSRIPVFSDGLRRPLRQTARIS